MPEFSIDSFLTALAALQPAGTHELCIALSGGPDSMALLHMLAEVRQHNPQLQLRALHIDHQLHADAAQWARHCVQWAAQLNIPCEVISVEVIQRGELGVEAAARKVRYAAFKAALRAGEILLTAHHADDQLETVMLALMRGAGVDGLAAMPTCIRFGMGWHARPLLGFTHAALRAWLQERALPCIADPSNDDTHYDRNFLRQAVLPLLKTRWPALARTASRSAAHLAEAQQLLDDWTHHDYVLAAVDDALSVAALRELPASRCHALLRYWLRQHEVCMPSTRILHSLAHDMLYAAHDRVPCVQWQDVAVHRHRELLYLEKPIANWNAHIELVWSGRQALCLPNQLGELTWCNRAASHSTDDAAIGIAAAKLPINLRIRFRDGGERIRLPHEKHHRALKKLLQESAVLPWWRDYLPLLYAEDKLVAVADLWVSHEFAALNNEPSVCLVWQREQNITARA